MVLTNLTRLSISKSKTRFNDPVSISCLSFVRKKKTNKQKSETEQKINGKKCGFQLSEAIISIRLIQKGGDCQQAFFIKV